MKEVIVIGGGAAGLISAIYAKNSGSHVTILERNNNCGKKLLLTGNGRCNYWNEDQNLSHYHTQNSELLDTIITVSNQKNVLDFFQEIVIVPKVKNGYYYPFSNQASSIKMALLKEIEVRNIKIKHNFLVEKIEKRENQFIITSKEEKIKADAIILATGSCACPKTGSDGMGYQFLREFGHTIIPVLPSLVQLKAEEKYLKHWDGIRCDVILSLYIDNDLKKQESGEVQLTNYGISGICTFNISSLASRALYEKKKIFVSINFIPWAKTKNIFINFLKNQNSDKNISELLEGFLHYKLIPIILKQANIHENSILTETNLEVLWDILTNFTLQITDTNSFDSAQTCSGGIPLTEINTKTMESKIIKNLYLAGEIIDVDGDCGGYNLTFSWISGMLAGIGAGQND